MIVEKLNNVKLENRTNFIYTNQLRIKRVERPFTPSDKFSAFTSNKIQRVVINTSKFPRLISIWLKLNISFFIKKISE